MFNASDANYYEYHSMSRPLPQAEKYFITITSRKRWNDRDEFAYALSRVLFATKYPSDLRGYIEYAQVSGYHFHGYSYHKYNHFKKKSGWFAMVKKIDNLNAVTAYILKGSNREI